MKKDLVLLAVMFALIFAAAAPARAHCDTLGGPVVQAARAALEASDITPVLKWLKPEQEQEARAAFARALRVRRLGGEAADLADRYFFETVVRLHRAGEGEPYTGLKDTPVPPEIAAADRALEKGDASAVTDELAAAIAAGARRRFAVAAEKRKPADDSVAAGREYVEAYVRLMHYVEAVHQLAAGEGAHEAERAHR